MDVVIARGSLIVELQYQICTAYFQTLHVFEFSTLHFVKHMRVYIFSSQCLLVDLVLEAHTGREKTCLLHTFHLYSSRAIRSLLFSDSVPAFSL